MLGTRVQDDRRDLGKISSMRTTKALALRATTDKWRDEMQRVRLSLAALLTSASAFGVATPASAVTYPVCLAGGEADTLQCDYTSLQQCRAAASGIGYCATNPHMPPTLTRMAVCISEF